MRIDQIDLGNYNMKATPMEVGKVMFHHIFLNSLPTPTHKNQ